MGNAPPAPAPTPPPFHPQAQTAYFDATAYRGFAGHRPPPPVAPLRRPRPRAFRAIELGGAVAIAALVDVALWGPPANGLGHKESGPVLGGFGLALLCLALPAVLLVAARRFRRSWRLGAIAGAIALVALRLADDPSVSLLLASIVLLAGFAFALRTRNVNVPDAVRALLVSVGRLPAKVGAFGRGAAALGQRSRLGAINRSTVLPIAIPAGLVVVFAGVFALANPIVASSLDAVGRALGSFLAPPDFGRIVLFVGALVLAIGFLRPAARLVVGAETRRPSDAGEATMTSLLVARNALACLNVLFLGYNLLDARYLWSGSPPAGMQTQQYAHEGAFWLTVALVLLTLVVGLLFRGPLATDPRALRARHLAFVWLAQGAVLGLGTWRRIAIHIARSGLSDLRIVGILGTTLVLSGVALVAWKLHRQKTFTWLLRRQLEAFVVVGVLYALLPTHLVSARVNVTRIERGEMRPVLHVFRQSRESESAAELLPLLEHADPRVRKGVAALLTEERTKLRGVAERRASWREGDLATRRALGALEAASGRIDQALDGADTDEARRDLLDLSRAVNAAM